MEVYFPLRKINEDWPQWYALGDKRLVQLCGCPNRTLRQLCGCPKDRKDRRPLKDSLTPGAGAAAATPPTVTIDLRI